MILSGEMVTIEFYGLSCILFFFGGWYMKKFFDEEKRDEDRTL